MTDEADILYADNHQNFLQEDAIIFGKLSFSIFLSIAKHFRSNQTSLLLVYNISRKKLEMNKISCREANIKYIDFFNDIFLES